VSFRIDLPRNSGPTIKFASFFSCLVLQVGRLVGSWRLVVQGGVWADLVVVDPPGFNDVPCLLQGGKPVLEANQCWSKHSARKRPLKASREG
jgi:hypothetical protein